MMRAIRSMGIYPLLSVLSFIAFVLHLWLTHDGSATTRNAVHSILKDAGTVTLKDEEAPLDFDAQIRNETLGVSCQQSDHKGRYTETILSVVRKDLRNQLARAERQTRRLYSYLLTHRIQSRIGPWHPRI